MRVDGKAYRTIWLADDGRSVEIIDQTLLPHRFAIVTLRALDDAVRAIKTMQARGAPLIGATAAYGICLAIAADSSDQMLDAAYDALLATRPTAVNLHWALDDMRAHLRNRPRGERVAAAYKRAAEICAPEDIIVRMDCDDTHEPDVMYSMIDKLEEGYDVVIASRRRYLSANHGIGGRISLDFTTCNHSGSLNFCMYKRRLTG